MVSKDALYRAAFAVMLSALIASVSGASQYSGAGSATWFSQQSGSPAPSFSFGRQGAMANSGSGTRNSGPPAISPSFATSPSDSTKYMYATSPAYSRSFAASSAYSPSYAAPSTYQSASFTSGSFGSGHSGSAGRFVRAVNVTWARNKVSKKQSKKPSPAPSYTDEEFQELLSSFTTFKAMTDKQRALFKMLKLEDKRKIYKLATAAWAARPKVERPASGYTEEEFKDLLSSFTTFKDMSEKQRAFVGKLKPSDKKKFYASALKRVKKARLAKSNEWCTKNTEKVECNGGECQGGQNPHGWDKGDYYCSNCPNKSGGWQCEVPDPCKEKPCSEKDAKTLCKPSSDRAKGFYCTRPRNVKNTQKKTLPEKKP